MRFVPVKTEEQQSRLMVHRARQGFVAARTATINRIRGLMSEFGIVLPQKAEVVRREACNHLEDVRVHGVQRRRLTQLQADGDGCAPRGRGRPSAGRHGGQRARKQARRRGVGDGREHGLVHELPQVHPLAQAGLMNAEATSHKVVAAQ